MELKNNFVFWSKNESEKVHGQIVKIGPHKDMDGQQKQDKYGTPLSKIVLRTEDQGDVAVIIKDTQRVFFEPKLGKRGYICHDCTNNYLTFEEDEEYRIEPEPVREPLSIEDLFPVEEVEDGLCDNSMSGTLERVEDYCDRINELLNNKIMDEDEINGAYLRRVRDANIGTVKEIIDLRMRDVI